MVNNVKSQFSQLFIYLVLTISAFLGVTGVLDTPANEHLQTSLNRSLTAFLTARTLNATISVAQGTQVAVEPGGLGLVLTPGQILDPLNKLIEQLSTVLLISSTSIGLQILLLEVVSSIWISLLIIFSIAGYIIFSLKFMEWSKARQKLLQTATVIVIIRLMVPVLTILSSVIFENFLYSKFIAAKQVIESSQSDLPAMFSADKEIGSSWNPFEIAKAALQTVTEIKAKLEARIEAYRTLVETYAGHLINFILVFVFDAIAFPLMFLFILKFTIFGAIKAVRS